MRHTNVLLTIFCFFSVISLSFGQDSTDNSWKTYKSHDQLMEVAPDTNLNQTPPTLQFNGPGKTQIFQENRIVKYSDMWNNDTERSGYRILIYQGTSSEDAKAAKTRFFYKYDNQQAYIDWRSPKFIVLVGDYRTRLEAEEFLYQLRERYPSSYIIKSGIQPTKL